MYHVFPVTATAGAVKSMFKEANGTYTITLADGTVLTPSKFFNATTYSEALKAMEWALSTSTVVAPNFAFTLDTHGHYMGINNEQFKTVAYYTGQTKNTNPSDYPVDFAYLAQFVDVATGEIEEIPVTAAWVAKAYAGGYYDITDELNGNETYYPVKVGPADYGAYRFYADKTAFSSTTNKVDDLYFNRNTVTFIIASHEGSKLVVDKYTGVSGLIEGFQTRYKDSGITTVVLKNMAMLTTETPANNEAVSIIFAYDGIVSAKGGVAFFPTDVTTWGVQDDGYYIIPAYLNGSKVTENIAVPASYKTSGIEAGFYSYTIVNGVYTFNGPLAEGKWGTVESDNDIKGVPGDYVIVDGNKSYALAETTPVIDLRSTSEKVSTIEGVVDLMETNYNKAFAEKVLLAYVVKDNAVQYIYVVSYSAFYYNLTVANATGNSDFTVSATATTTAKADGARTVTVTLSPVGENAWKQASYDITYTVNGDEKTVTKTASDSTPITFDVTGVKDCAIVITGLTGSSD